MKMLITFGNKYRNETHPVNSSIHPDGVVEVNVQSEEEARQLAFQIFGRNWSMIREKEGEWDKFFPRGVIGKVTDRGVLVINV